MDHILSFRDPRQRMKALATIPRNMSAAYEDVMLRIERSKRGDKALAIKILSWLFHTKAPLSMNELLEALVVEDGDQELQREYMLQPADVIDCCKSLVVYESSSGMVRFTHYTVQEYIEAIEHKLLGNIAMAKTCLTYLAFDEFDVPCTPDTYSEIYERREKYKLLSHAVNYWANYVAGEPEASLDVQEMILKVFASQSKRESYYQILHYNSSYGKTETFFHILADYGLTTVCKLALKAMQDIEKR